MRVLKLDLRIKMTSEIKKIIIGLTIFMCLFGGLTVYAEDPPPKTDTTPKQYEYTVLSPLPGTTEGECKNAGDPGCKTNLKTYIEGLFKLLLGLSVVFVVINFIIGGFQYITSAAMPGKKDGKERIINSIKGLVLVVGAWIILNTINPALLKVDLTIESNEIKSNAVGGSLDIPIPEGYNKCGDNCVQIPSNVATINGRSNSMIEKATLDKLKSFDQELAKVGINDWTITEAYPATMVHQNICHQYGTCIDIAKVPDTKVADAVLAASKAGLLADFETDKPVRKTQIINTACGDNQACRNLLESRIKVYEPKYNATTGKYVPQIRGEHFSIYNNR